MGGGIDGFIVEVELFIVANESTPNPAAVGGFLGTGGGGTTGVPAAIES